MMTMKRTSPPNCLKKNWKSWTTNYIRTGKWNSTYYKNRDEISEKLKNNTLYHCAFCDDLLIPAGSADEQIEHFRPKEKFKCYAYVWLNLYPCCSICNGTKKDNFDSLLLKPDAKDYEFDNWFRLDYNSFELKHQYLLDFPDIQRVEKTIKLYGLNKAKKVNRRKYEYNQIIKGKYDNLDEQPFRFMLL